MLNIQAKFSQNGLPHPLRLFKWSFSSFVQYSDSLKVLYSIKISFKSERQYAYIKFPYFRISKIRYNTVSNKTVKKISRKQSQSVFYVNQFIASPI